MPKVSVIVPVYNVQPYISKCLDSLHAQTMLDIEFIIVDDCGTDDSMCIARQYAHKDARFKILNGTENKGVAHARNRGIEAATGDYIGFVDSDDWVSSEFYQLLYEKAISEEADIAKATLYIVRNNLFEKYCDNDALQRCLKYNRWMGLVFNHNFFLAIYRASILKQFGISFPELQNGEDCVFHINYMLHAKKVSIVENAFYFYLQREASAIRSIRKLTYSTWFGHPEIVGKMLNASALPKRDLLEGWHRLVMGCLLSKRIPSCMNNGKDAYIAYVTRVKGIFLSSGHAEELCSRYPSMIYYDLLRKSSEQIVQERINVLPKLERNHELVLKFMLDLLLRISRREFLWRYGGILSALKRRFLK